MTESRNKLRIRIKKLRSLQSDETIKNKSKIIANRLFSLPKFQESKQVAFYSSFHNEVSTDSMIDYSINLGKDVFLPKINQSQNTMTFYKISSRHDLEKGAFNILEPSLIQRSLLSEYTFKLIIVPGIAFDYSGNRLGFGYGYYDSFLKDKNELYKIGLAFDFQLSKIDNKTSDVPMDLILTETGLIRPK